MCIRDSNCGTPTPATILVVQLEPAPMPIFTQSAPAFIKSSVASGVATFPAIKSKFGNSFFTSLTNFKTN